MEYLEQDFKLDDFQEKAIAAVGNNHSVLVAAPTGAGKTLIAEYLIKKCLRQDQGIIYTAPIKALSNQKYRDFELLFPGKVGIITGDVSINPNAPLLIMTTEIFRNRILEAPWGLEQHHWIIFDEIHYLDDLERGTVWEESLIFLPVHMRFLGLSATIPNARQFSAWLREIHPHTLTVIQENKRPVPLHFMFQCQGRVCNSLNAVKQVGYTGQKKGGMRKNTPLSLIQHLLETDRLPCIYFTFSRRRSEYLAEDALINNFLSDAERSEILGIFDSHCTLYGLEAEERTAAIRKLVARGIAYHHAGVHPLLKEILERLFTGKRIKLIFTTETFALGINMPARTVVLDELRKNYGKFFRALKVRDFFQMAGRSGRRGIDKEGFVYSRVNPRDISFRELQHIITSTPEIIQSRFNASYATILNLYETHGEQLVKIHARSFHYFQGKHQGKAGLKQLDQMKARLAILKQFGYIQNEQLTEKGHFAKKIHGHELPISELYSLGILDGLSVDQLGILALAAVFELRPGTSSKKFQGEVRKLQKLTYDVIRRIHQLEKKMKIDPLSKKFYFDLSESITNWMKFHSFQDILQQLQVDEGEVIRYFRMSIQILREILDTPAVKDFKKRVHEAISLIDRGVIDAEAQLRQTIEW